MHGSDKAITLALSLAQAERAIHAFSAGQVDAIVDAEGGTYLLRPAQEHLLRNESQQRAILESSPDVITVLSRSGQILSQSGAIGRVLDRGHDELIGTSIFTLVHPDDWTQFYAAFFNVAEGFVENATVQFRHQAREGSWRLLEATAGRLHDAHAAPFASVVLNLRAISALRPSVAPSPPTAATSAPVQPAKARFLAMISHELRTPLTPVLLGVAELQEDERFSEARPVLAMIRRNVDLQSRLLDELMEFTLVGQHKVRLRLEPLDAHEHIRFVLEICQSELTAAEIAVRLDLANNPDNPLVCADSVRLQQVMWNLIKNAIKFSPARSSISIVTTDGPAGHMTIDFTDEGVGIEPALLPLVFEAFQQGSDSQQRAKGGLGLGLFIAKGLAEAQEGTLSVHSEGLGQGSTFRLTLPKAPTDRVVPPIEIHSRFSDSVLRPTATRSGSPSNPAFPTPR